MLAVDTVVRHPLYQGDGETKEWEPAGPDSAHPGQCLVRVWFPNHAWTTVGGEARTGISQWIWEAEIRKHNPDLPT